MSISRVSDCKETKPGERLPTPRLFYIVCLAAVLGIFFWLLESAIHVLIFRQATFVEQIFAPEPHELWMRLVVIALLIGIGIFAHGIVARQRLEEKKGERLNRVLRSVREVDRLISRGSDKESLLQDSCRNLVRHRGYNNAWIMLLDHGKRPLEFFQAGTGEAFSLLRKSLKGGPVPACVGRSLERSAISVIEDPVATCRDCPAAPHYEKWAAFTTRLEYKDDLLGVICASVPKEYAGDREEQALFREIADDLAVALYNLQIQQDHKKQEEELRLRNLAITVSAEAIAFADLNMRLTYVNSSFLQMWGYKSAEEVLGRSALDFWSDRHTAREVVLELDRSGVWKGELTGRRRDASIFPARVRASIARDEDNKPLCMMGIFEDISDFKQAEEEQRKLENQLRQSQKLETVGRLAGGVAHDFNNLLTVLLTSSELALTKLTPGDPFFDEFMEIKSTAERASELTSQLLAFSRRQITEPRVIDPNRIVSEMEKMFRRLIGEDIEIAIFPCDDPWQIKIDPSQFEQVLTNLVVNARDAMPGGGRLSIETANVRLDDHYVARHVGTKPGDFLMIAVSDTGSGIDQETADKIFEPFFTTKGQGEGTGLGLSTCYGIVKQNGGSIWVYSEPGQGTCFKIYLPRTSEVPVQAFAETEVYAEGSETVLVVEDESSVRRMINLILSGKGYSVVEAAHGDEALEIAAGLKEPVHLLLTDVVMPRMGGRELMEHLKKMYAGVKVLFMSGYTEDSIVHHGFVEPGLAFLPKPFTPAGLLKKVRQVLDK